MIVYRSEKVFAAGADVNEMSARDVTGMFCKPLAGHRKFIDSGSARGLLQARQALQRVFEDLPNG
ncbi:MAG: hypothetical protein GY896_07195 [Gammaproteobacteria bacterium]|nr:hypothetical protein [Gammaproteobacteria bacterium]